MKVKREKGIVVAVDIVGQEASMLCGAIGELEEGNFALKLGRPLEKIYSMNVIEWVKQQVQDKVPIIYDGKIADVPFISADIAKEAYKRGADAVIVQGFCGKDVVKAILDLNAGEVIVVVAMSHPGSKDYIDAVALPLAQDMKELGVHGVVLPATDIDMLTSVKNIIGDDCYIISPGVKVQGAKVGDAVKNGATYEVIGRAIYTAENPKEEALKLYKEIV
jgi:orotidine-5'-phosphate decarboxylase